MPNTSNHPNTLIYHKPTCQCPPCKRKKEAEPRGTGIEQQRKEAEARLPPIDSNPDVIHADGFPPVLAADRSFRTRVLQIMALRQKGLSNQQIADRLGLQLSYIKTLVWRAGKEGWLKFEDPAERFENELMPKVVDNIAYWLDQKDKKMTIEAAKGGGLFKTHQSLKVEGQAPSQVLAIKIEMPPTGNMASTPTAGKVVGKPRSFADLPEVIDVPRIENNGPDAGVAPAIDNGIGGVGEADPGPVSTEG